MKTETTFITTFNKTGYDLYGRAWVKTFIDQTAGESVKARIYCEQFTPDQVNCDRIEFVDFYTEIPEHLVWKSDYTVMTPHLSYTKKMTVRFSFKAFAMAHALSNLTSDYVIWLDGDCIFTGSNYDNFASEVVGDNLMACQVEKGDLTYHVESGVLVFNNKHKDKQQYLEKFKDLYSVSNIINMPNDQHDITFGRYVPWSDYGPYDGFITHKTLAETGIKYTDLNNNDPTVAFTASPDQTFYHPSLTSRFVHNIGHEGKNNYASINSDMCLDGSVTEWSNEKTDAMSYSPDPLIFTVNGTFEDRKFDFTIHDPSADICISRNILLTSSWEPHISKLIVDAMKPGGVFVDIGANIGWHTRVVQEYGFETVSFEPEPSNWEILKKNCTKDNATLHNVGLGAQDEIVNIHRDPINYGNSYVDDAGENQITIVRLDDVLDTTFAKRVNVVKIDVQGYEANVLQGGRRFFDALEPGTLLVVEICPAKLGRDIKHITKFLANTASSYAICFWADEGDRTEMPVLDAIVKCLNPSERVLTAYKSKFNLDFDAIIRK